MPFTPIHTLIGGFLLHVASSSLLSDTGRVFGVSGVVSGAIWTERAVAWRWAILAGLLSGPSSLHVLGGDDLLPERGGWRAIGLSRAALAGYLVGLGVRVSLELLLYLMELVHETGYDECRLARDVPGESSCAPLE